MFVLFLLLCSNERYTACPGDSGGPLIWGHSVIGTGAAVFLEPCGTGYSWWPSSAVYNSWIDTHVQKYGLNPPLYAPKDCYDKDIGCAYWSGVGECKNSTHDAFMKDECRLSCGFCDVMPSPSPSPSPKPAPSPSNPPFRGCKSWQNRYWKNRRCVKSPLLIYLKLMCDVR